MGKLWSADDTALLVERYCTTSASELHAMFPNRTMEAIRKKARKMGFYVPDELEFINRSAARSGEKSNLWKGGLRFTPKGYVQRLDKSHPRADVSGYVMEHIRVWESETGIPVPPGFCIHHLDGDKTNNDISNLCLMRFDAHTIYHNKHRRKK